METKIFELTIAAMINSRENHRIKLLRYVRNGVNKMLEDVLTQIALETKRVADRLEMIHNHLVKLPEKDSQLDSKLIKTELTQEGEDFPIPTSKTSSPMKPSKESKTTGSKGKAVTMAAAEDIDILGEEIEEAEQEAEEELEGLEPVASNGDWTEDEIADKCKAVLDAGKDKEARSKIRTLFVEVLKNTFGKEKLSELKPADRKTFYTTFEKRVKEKK
jgi:hypothetical protein